VIQRRAVVGAVLVAAILALSGCGLEVKDETSREQSPIQAKNVSIGAIDVRDAFITYPTTQSTGPGEEAPLPIETGGTGYLVVTIVNNGTKPDTLTGVTSPLGTLTMSGGQSTVQLLPGIPVAFGAPQFGGTGPTLQLAPGGTAATEGTNVPVTFSFAGSGSRTVPVPVVESDDITTAPTRAVPTPTTTETLPSEGLQPATQ
jgi:copper(I)-binding protein